jgi:serine/threonine protein kinase
MIGIKRCLFMIKKRSVPDTISAMPTSPSSFKLTRRLRSGHASSVMQYTSAENKAVAVKYLRNKQDAKDEVKTLSRFWHPNVMNYIDFIHHGGAYGIVMRVMDMDLRHFMSTELYDSTTVCAISRQSAQGLHHVHSLQTLHADIKPENIGISVARGVGNQIKVHVRLLDFGSAKLVAEIKAGDVIRSTRVYQSPEKQRGVFHLPGDIYELGAVYKEVINNSVDKDASNELFGGLAADMLLPEYSLRPTSQQVLVRLNDPLIALWERLSSASASGDAQWKTNLDFLIQCPDPLTFLPGDLEARMEFIVKLLSSDSMSQMEKAFFLLFKTAQGGEDCVGVTHYLHAFHGVVDTTWWTKLFYCMSLDALSALPGFLLSDVIKIKLWAFSGVTICERFVRSVFSKCMTHEHLVWCSGLRWGVDCVDFAAFVSAVH